MSIQIKVEGAKVSFAKWAFKPMAATWRSRIAPVVLTALKEEAPIYKYADAELSRGENPGDLKKSIKLDSVGGSIGEGIEMVFISDVPYAKYVVSGTRGHRIPLSGDAQPMLHWTRVPWGPMYRLSVNHPGTTANNFPKRAIERVQPVVGRELEVLVADYIKPTQA